LLPVIAGGLAFRAVRMGFFPSSSPLVRTSSLLAALGTESAIFEQGHRSLLNGTEEGSAPYLWNWNEKNGLREGSLSSPVAFSALKGLGRIAEGQNPVVQHGAQTSGILLGHQLVHRTGLGEKPEGTWAEQFVQAEARNLQWAGGMSLSHALTG